MADISEEDAILHLKRALGEADAGDGVPMPLPPVQRPKPPPPKMQKTAPAGQTGPGIRPPSLVPALGTTKFQDFGAPTPAPSGAGATKPSGSHAAAVAAVAAAAHGGSFGPGGPPQIPGLQGLGALPGQKGGPAPRPVGQLPGGLPPGLGMGGPLGVPGLLSGMPGMPPMPGLPAGLKPPQAPAQAAPPAAPAGPSGAQQASQAAAASGKDQSEFEISQGKVGLIMGQNGTTFKAIQAYSKAQSFIDEHTPEPDKAKVYVVGSARQTMKCKQTILALADGTMSLETLFQLAGMPMPAGAKEHAEAAANAAAAPAVAGAGAAAAPVAAPPGLGALPPLGAGFPGLGGLAPPPFLGGLPPPGATLNLTGHPNEQMQQNLNDYYARMYATYGKQQQEAAAPKRDENAQAFDMDALKRLAEKAASGEAEEEAPAASSEVPAAPGEDAPMGLMEEMPPPPPGLAGTMSSSMPPPSGLVDNSGAAPAGTSGLAPGQVKNFTLKGFLRPGGETAKPKKDDDSVQKMMERLHGNVQQSKQVQENAPQGGVQQPLKLGQVFGSPEAGMQYAAVGRQDTRTRADVEFEALIQKMQALQTAEDVEHVGREVLIRFNTFQPSQVAELLQKVSSCEGLQHDDFLAELTRLVIPRLRELTSAQFTSLTSTLASWSAQRSNRSGKSRFMELSRAFFSAASLEMSSRLMEFAPHEVNCCLAAFVSVGFSEHKFFAAVGRAALARHTSFAPVQLTALLAILSEMRLVHLDLFNAAANFLSSRAKELRPVDIIRVMRSYSKCNVKNETLCRAVSSEVVARVKDKGFNVAFKAEELCEICWAMVVLEQYDEALFKLLFKALTTVPMISTDALLMVFETHLALEADHKDQYSKYAIGYDLVQTLQDHYREHRKDERRCSERLRNDVASVLKSLVDGSVHVNHRTSCGMLVDVAALRRRSSTDGFIHVDLDSNVTCVRSLDQEEQSNSVVSVDGPVSLRRKVLAKHGLRIITVRESEWRGLDDSKDKRRYLRGLLANLGDVLK
eukprot:TRINITY_DN90460_c0_g1_i1.p1 TRINITY_DN90460_c0_g1~~TRINITY_DN90460_c0_g1_i1.p1  ORF type:complete len:1022 (-),score=314.46 TRINITY_DN90460_c0_g1_i1:49-3114(-)